MTTNEPSARLHRFHNSVAVSFNGAPRTFYLSAALARQLGEELLRYAREVGTTEFTESTIGSITLYGAEECKR